MFEKRYFFAVIKYVHLLIDVECIMVVRVPNLLYLVTLHQILKLISFLFAIVVIFN